MMVLADVCNEHKEFEQELNLERTKTIIERHKRITFPLERFYVGGKRQRAAIQVAGGGFVRLFGEQRARKRF